MPYRIGKANKIEKFDSQFFNIPAIESHIIDPTARILLEHTYEAIIDAGINPKELRGTKTGICTAVCCDVQSQSCFVNSEVQYIFIDKT